MSYTSSIRTRLILLVAAALVPVFVSIGFNEWEGRRQAVQYAKEQAETIFELVVLNEQQALLETKDLLAGLSTVPVVVKGGAECSEHLAALLKSYPRFLNLGFIRPDGTLACSALPFRHVLNLKDREYFRDALKRRTFSVGKYQVGRVTGMPSVNFGYPVAAPGGGVAGVVFAALDLSYTTEVVDEAWFRMPAGTTFARLDRGGAVLSSYPYPLLSERRNDAEREIVETVLEHKQGTITATGADGVKRMYLYSPIWRTADRDEGYILLGIPRISLLADSARRSRRALAILALVAGMTVLVVWFAAERLIVRPVSILVDASKRLASGDLSARVALPYKGELGNLGAAFDEMAKELEKKTGELSAMQARLARILAASPAVIYAGAAPPPGDGGAGVRLDFVSENIRDLLGYEARELLGSAGKWKECIHPDDLSGALDLGSLFESGTLSREYRLRTKAGSYRWILDQSVLMGSSEGRLVEFVGSWTDITDRRNAEEIRALLGLAVDQAAEAVVITDPEGRIEYVNPAFGEITGYTSEEAIGKTPAILKSGRHDEAFYRNLWDTISQGSVWKGQFINRKKDGTFYDEEATISPVRNSSGEIVNFVAGKRDVTQELALRKQVQTAQRMEAVGTLAGGIAHDFNNVLTGIIGFAELAKARMAANAEAKSSLDEILRCAERAAALTRQLLTYSRRQIIAPVNLGLNEVIADLMKLASNVVGENIEIRTALEKDLPAVRADQGQMEQVIMNLVLNSRDAMPGGGRLLIATGMVDVEEAVLRDYPYMRAGRFVVLTISDTGTGMDSDTRERAFDPFFTTKGPDRGSGLGMAVVYGIVKQHGGFIQLHSEVGVGTTIKIYLPPLAVPPDPPRSTAASSEIRGGTETILLAEDNTSVRRFIERTLAELGYTILAATDGEEAVALFARNRDRISLALLDVVMPRKGGKEAYEAMARENAGLKVVYMSGYADAAIHDSFVLAAGVPFLQKPFSPALLARMVREVLDGVA